MSKEMTIMVLGVWVMILPQLGFPSSWRAVLLFITGFLIVVVGFLLRKQALAAEGKHTEHRSFVENTVLPEPDVATPRYDRKERINSLN